MKFLLTLLICVTSLISFSQKKRNHITISRHNSECVIDENNNELIPSGRYKKIWTAYDTLGKYFVVTNFAGKKGIYELGKTEVVPCIYDDINFFLNRGFVSNGEKWAIMSSNFVKKSDYVFDEYGYFDKEDVALVKQDAKWVLIDTNGKIIRKLNYDKAYQFNESDIYKKAEFNGKFGYVDRNYKNKIPFEYEDVGDAISHKNDVFPAKLNGKWGYINSENKIIVPFKYLYATPIYKGFGLLKGENFKTIGLVNSFGKILFDDNRYEDIEYSEESKIIYKIKDTISKKYLKGYLDSSTLKVVIKAEFDNCESFYKGMAIVKKNGLSALIDTANKLILPYYYEFLSRWGDNYLATLKGKTGMIDRNGKILIPLIYENFSHSGYYIYFGKNGFRGILHYNGKLLIEPLYDNVRMISESVFLAEKGKDKFLITLNGLKRKIE